MHDVIIVGGALNGLTTALALAGHRSRTPLDVLVIDGADPSRPPSAEMDRRGSAITDASRNLLTAVGAWDAIAPHAERMRSVEVVDGPEHSAPVLLSFGDSGSDASAYIVENHNLLAGIRLAVERSPAIRLCGNAKVATALREPGRVLVTLEDGSTHSARLLIGADGRHSRIRQEAGIDTVGWDYRQCGLVLTIEHAYPHHGVAEERFLPPGPFATLPLPGNRSTLVWTESPERARELMSLPHADIGRELAARLNPRLGALISWSPLQSWPLMLLLAKQFTAPRLALVGDAAHVVHPLAGLGFNLGIKDSAALAEVVTDAARAGSDIGAPDVLERYAQWRRADTLSVIAATEVLNRLFSNDNSGLKLLRDAGLRAVDRLAPLKGAFVREAAGLAGTMPKLLSAQPL